MSIYGNVYCNNMSIYGNVYCKISIYGNVYCRTTEILLRIVYIFYIYIY